MEFLWQIFVKIDYILFCLISLHDKTNKEINISTVTSVVDP